MASACSGSSSEATPVSSEADRLALEIQPIQVCDDGGMVCAQVELFETIADKIWDQADIDITFLPPNQLNDSTYLTTDDDEFFDLSFTGSAGSFGRHPDSTRTSGPINLWFVDVIESSNGLIQFGNAWVGFNGVLISDDILDFNNGIGRLDVIAHEIGHNLGLRHSTFGAGDANNLMSSGGVRTVPESIDDIFPDGDKLSQLTPEQIEHVQDSDFLKDLAADEDTLLVTAADAPIHVHHSHVHPHSHPHPHVHSPHAHRQPYPTADAIASLTPSQTAAAAPVSIPEPSSSFLPWLLLLPLGQHIHRRISCRSSHG
ncbi:zinc-dependent metalloprotease family protein [Leptolyngbya ectocarpi]|nr:zinc-dependent metalloprotease family protein [Leptolyngbya ectocarpi]